MRHATKVEVVTRLAILCGVAALCFASSASAQSHVILALDRGVEDERTTALRHEVALRGADVEVVPAIAGETRDDRERHARLLAQDRGALACVWLEDDGNEVHAVTPAGPARFARLPRHVGDTEPRVLAVVAASVLDEAIAPPRRLGAEGDERAIVDPAAAIEVEAIAPDAETLAIVLLPVEAPPPTDAPQGDAETGATNAPYQPAPEVEAPSVRDGNPHFEIALDAYLGAVWSLGQQNNVAHMVQRITPVMRIDDLRFEIPLGFGLNVGMESGTRVGAMLEACVYVGTSIEVGMAGLDLGGLVGVVGHTLVDARDDLGNWLVAGRIAGVIGIVTPDDTAAFPFRARLEIGAFARAEPGLFAPFTNVVLGVAFR